MSICLFSCAFYHEKDPGDPATIVASQVSWQQVSSGFFQPRCAVCHGLGGAGIDTTDYAAVIQQLKRIQQAVVEKKNMPPDSPLTPYEEKLFNAWIDNGTPYFPPGQNQ